MARRAFKVIDVVEVLVHWHSGRPIGELCMSLSVDPKTVRKYTAPARAAGLLPGGPVLSREEWSALVAGWFPDLVDPSRRRATWPEFDPHRQRIKDWIGVVTVATMHQRLADDHGVRASESSLRRFIVANFDEEVARAAVTVLRDTPPPGQEAQVDYGFLGTWVDPATGRRRRVWGFLIVLACSRLLFLRPVIKMDQLSWVEAHVAAVEYFGGCPARIVPDNLKTGVIKADLYDPKINRSFDEFARHYDCLVDPARALKPKDKPRVERIVPYARDSFFAGRAEEFTSLAAMQADALRWCDAVANRRQCRPLDRRSPREVFDAIERDAMLALPRQPFVLARWSTPKVNPDIHIKVAKTLYSVPWRLIGRTVDAREAGGIVEVFNDGVLVKTHVAKARGKVTDYADYPPEKIAFFMRTPTWCRRRSGELGEAVSTVVTELLSTNALYRLRQAQGVVGLAEKYSAERLDAACARSLAVGDPTYRTVKGILVAGTEHEAEECPELPPSAPAHLHGPERLFAPGGAAG